MLQFATKLPGGKFDLFLNDLDPTLTQTSDLSVSKYGVCMAMAKEARKKDAKKQHNSASKSLILECKILNTNERDRPPSVTYMLAHTTDVLDLYDDFTSITSSRISISEVNPKNLASSRTPAMKKRKIYIILVNEIEAFSSITCIPKNP